MTNRGVTFTPTAGGDNFASGVIYALMAGHDPQTAVV